MLYRDHGAKVEAHQESNGAAFRNARFARTRKLDDLRPVESCGTMKRKVTTAFLATACHWNFEAEAFQMVSTASVTRYHSPLSRTLLFAEWKDSDNLDSNKWRANDDMNLADQPDWQEALLNKQDGSFWSTFEPSNEDDDSIDKSPSDNTSALVEEEDASEAWLKVLAELSAEEVEFNIQEAERADKARQMQEWGFESSLIASVLGVATDASLEDSDEVQGMQAYRETSYLDEVDLQTVESHSTVEKDEETGEPLRTQMVYVDEHSCIGCTNCAMIAQSTFFMHQEHGRARVFQQWGDDQETIQVAIETCPVDCIHYVPYDELVALEKDRRGQNINFKARLVSQAEGSAAPSHRVGGGQFTAPQNISGNSGSRCSNCPTRGCADCPMYGVGKNPFFEEKEKERKARIAKRRLLEQRELDQKTADL